MRILLLHDELFPNTSANARVVYRIVDQLLHFNNVSITIIGRAQTEEQFTPYYHSAKIEHTPWLQIKKYQSLVKHLGAFKWLRYLLFPRSIIYRLLHKQLSEPYYVEVLLWGWSHRKQFDVVLACSMPEYTVAIASKLSKYIPVVYYYMEPLLEIMDQRSEWDNNATKIILPAIYADTTIGNNRKKNVLAEFCNVTSQDVTITSVLPKSKNINFVFAGKFYPDIRHPQYLFDLMEHLQTCKGINDEPSYLLHMFGGFNGSFPKDFVKRYFTNTIPYLHFYGFVQPDVADMYLLQADVLVHIANKTSSQMPSKILSYIATGKPILNFYYNDDCPTLEVLKPYPMVFNIKMNTPITDSLLQSVDQFCTQYRGQQIPYKNLETLYTKYTPEYVGTIFYQTLFDVVKK